MTPPYLPILVICLVSTALVVVGLGRRRHLQRSHRVALVACGLLGFAWVGWVIYETPILGNLTLAEVAGPYRHTNRGVVDRLELRKDCSFSRTLTVGGAVVVRQAGQWGRRSADDVPACAGKDGERLTQLMFVGFEPGCGKRLSEIELEPGLRATRPFCEDEKPALELATVCTAAGRACVEANWYHWIRE